MPLQVNYRPTRRLAYSALLLALSLLLSYVESLVPLSFALPGMKPGLANVAIMFAFLHIGRASGVAISFCRVLLVALLFGTAASFFFSLLGAALAALALFLLARSARFGRIGLSVGCACAHNLGQLLAAAMLYGPAVFSYLPYLLLSAVPFGALCGVLLYSCEKLLPRLRFV